MVEFLQHLRDEAGQTMAEYAVVLGVITIAVVVILGLLAGKISAVLGSVVRRCRSLRLPVVPPRAARRVSFRR